MRWLDATLPLGPETVVYPGDPPFATAPHASLDPRDPESYAVRWLTLGTHAGTHVDAPCHIDPKGPGIDAVPFETLCGPAVIVDCTRAPRRLEVAALAPFVPAGTTRVLVKTRGPGPLPVTFDAAYAHLALDAARWLRTAGVRLVGVDSPSVETWPSPGLAVHHCLLAEMPPIVVVEGLDLRDAPPGPCELIVLPMKLAGLDGAPARAFVGVA